MGTVLSVVAAAPAGAETGLDIRPFAGGVVKPGRPVPVRIGVRADQLVRGTLVVDLGQGTTVQLPVEIPGGSEKRFLVVVPSHPTLWDGRSLQLDVTLRAGSTVLARGSEHLLRDGTVEVVGVLGSLADDRPAKAALRVDAGLAHYDEVDDELLAAGPDALAVIDTLATSDDDLRALTASDRDVIGGWLYRGGHLIVDAPSTPSGLDASWRPAEGATSRAVGHGMVRVTAGELARGEWDEVIEPTPLDSWELAGEELFGWMEPFPVTTSLTRDAGFAVPSIGWLVVISLGYIVVVGPLVTILLRRGHRQHLAWLIIPATAVVTTALVYGLGSSRRSNVTTAHATIIESTSRGAWATTHLLVSSVSGGTVRVELPAQWSGSSAYTPWGEPSGDVVLSDEDVSTRLDPGAVGVLRAAGPLAVDPALELLALAEGPDGAGGMVRNISDVTLHHVTVFVGSDAVNIGSLEPGGEASWTLLQRTSLGIDGDPATRVWPVDDLWFDGVPDDDRNHSDDSAVNVGAWSDLDVRNGPGARSTGVATAVGWTTELAAPLTIDGPVRAGRTAFVTRAALTAADEADDERVISRTFVRGAQGARGGFGLAGVLGYTVSGGDGRAPGPGDDTPLVIEIPESVDSAELWLGGSWVRLPHVVDDRSVLALPRSLSGDRRVFVRVEHDLERFWSGGIAGPATVGLRPALPDERIDEVALAAPRGRR